MSDSKCFLWPKCTNIPTHLCECSHETQFICKSHRYKYTQEFSHKLIKFQKDLSSKKTQAEFLKNLELKLEEIDSILDININKLKIVFDDIRKAYRQYIENFILQANNDIKTIIKNIISSNKIKIENYNMLKNFKKGCFVYDIQPFINAIISSLKYNFQDAKIMGIEEKENVYKEIEVISKKLDESLLEIQRLKKENAALVAENLKLKPKVSTANSYMGIPQKSISTANIVNKNIVEEKKIQVNQHQSKNSVEPSKSNTYNVDELPLAKQTYGFTEEEVNEIKEAFDLFDYDSSGFIEIIEILPIIKDKSKSAYNNLIELQKNGLKEIYFDTFLKACGTNYNKGTRQYSDEVFNNFCDETTGKITLKSLKKVAQELGENLTDEELIDIIKSHDSDGDGQLSIDEFYTVMSRNHRN
ncbi:hypothetical protein SteCoe_28316 [Stentor coeruleus]|uniref:EF-hand domain-containing protein n=1 Tax=Stentor coeruleus TaxID=5963 RepID=A0A1R2B8H8_9CILI|nr:hypothetical protein SteCoe_28316 [Stentor coeruleus]